jgi:hypothetical protein
MPNRLIENQDQVAAPKKLPPSRTITPADVREWFGSRSRPNEALCDEIAGRLTKMRWPSDPPDDPDSPWLQCEILEPDTDRWWDFEGAADAAKTLLASVPAMLSFWDQLRWAPETRAGHEAIKALGGALSLALPYVEFPFGKYERQVRKRPKNWHVPAIIIASFIREALIQSGRGAPALTRNSVLVRVVRQALVRMEYPNIGTVTPTAIGAHLTRWADKYWVPARI